MPPEKKAVSVARSPFARADVTSIPGGNKKYVDGGRLLSMTKAFRNSGSTYLQGNESFFSQRDAVHDMARGMAPRTFTYNSVDPDQPNSPGSQKIRDAFAEAMENYEVGSDDWYATLADGYIDYLMKGGEL